ncbi:MAG: matrixin family metalloprotease [Bacteroidota bacterium]
MFITSVLSAGCSDEGIRLGNEFRYFLPSHVDTLDPRAIELTEEIFGIELVEQSEPWGAVTIFPFDRDAFEGAFEGDFDAAGESYLGRCTPWVWYVTDKPLALAHELGHAYGLAHVDEPCNVMLPRFSCQEGSFEASWQQIQVVREESWNQEHVCEGLSPPL